MAAVSITMGKFIAGIVIAILASSAIYFGVFTRARQELRAQRVLRDCRANEASDLNPHATFQWGIMHSCQSIILTMSYIFLVRDY
jgi:hypothetical protein